MPSRILLLWIGLPAFLVVVSGWLALRAERERLLGELREQGQEASRRLASEMAAGWDELRWWELPAETEGGGWEGGFFYPETPRPRPRAEAQDWLEAGDWEKVLREAPGELSEAGLPLGPLAALRGLKMTEDTAARASLLGELAELAVRRHPSVVSGALLQEALQLVSGEQVVIEQAVCEWTSDERLRAALREGGYDWRSPMAGWAGGMLVFFHAGETGQGWRMVKKEAVEQLLADASQRALPKRPAFAGYTVSLQGVELGRSEGLAGGEPLAFAEEGDIRVAWLWQEGPAFRVELWRRLKWTGGVLLLALLGCVAAGWQTLRAFRRQERLMRQQSNFLSSVSHELRAPLASLRLMTENLLSGKVAGDERWREYLEVMHDETTRLANLAGNVLDTTRMERGVKTYHFAVLDIRGLIEGVLRLTRVRAERLNVELNEKLEEIEPPPCGDAEALHQALLNLLDNALKHAPTGSEIEVTARVLDADTWVMEVRDQGPGIAEAEREKVWQAFYRTGSELRRETTGAGLGLSLVRHIAQGHGGRAEIDNAPGGGLVARMILSRRLECES